MKLQTVDPPERGSLSVVYSCPECGYEIAMLTNAYETQIVQSLGVRIGPETGVGASKTSGSGCPFSAMIPDGVRPGSDPTPPDIGVRPGSDPAPTQGNPGTPGSNPGLTPTVRWTAAAEARLTNVPEFVRPMARAGIERFARERGALEVDEQILDAAREFFGM
jgi:hypothetical protein